MSATTKYSLEDIEQYLDDPRLQNFVRRLVVNSYDEFVELVHDELDFVISLIEQNSQQHFESEEDQITGEIVRGLRLRHLKAVQGETSGGNVDITVHGDNELWTWICEAKIYSTLDNVTEGLLQLTTRYKNASPNFAKRGLLAYTKRPDAAELMREWSEHIPSIEVMAGYTQSDCSRRPDLAFYTWHKDRGTGKCVEVRHSAVVLFQLPEDKSGRSAKKFEARREKFRVDLAAFTERQKKKSIGKSAKKK